jgi:hypothetical protein
MLSALHHLLGIVISSCKATCRGMFECPKSLCKATYRDMIDYWVGIVISSCKATCRGMFECPKSLCKATYRDMIDYSPFILNNKILFYGTCMQKEKPDVVLQAESDLSKMNSRSNYSDRMSAYFCCRRDHLKTFTNFYGQMRYRIRRWRTFKKDQKSIAGSRSYGYYKRIY